MITPHDAEVDHPDTQETDKPYLAKCSCQTEGRFATQQEAVDWLKMHLRHVHADPTKIEIKEKQDGSVTSGGVGKSS